jgi:hypothetical protein
VPDCDSVFYGLRCCLKCSSYLRIPFAVLLPSNLAPRIADASQFDNQPDLRGAYKNAGKIIYLDIDQIWIKSGSSVTYPHLLTSPASPCPPPRDILYYPSPEFAHDHDGWKNAQDNEPEFFKTLDPASLALCNGLTVYKDADFPSRIVVP